MIKGGEDFRRHWPIHRLALGESVILMPSPLKMQPRSFDSARSTATGKVHPPLASLRMTELGSNTFADIPVGAEDIPIGDSEFSVNRR